MQKPVHDGIGQGWVSDVGMPVFDGALAGHDGRACQVTVLDDLEQVSPFDVRELGQQEVIDDYKLYTGEPGQGFKVGAITA